MRPAPWARSSGPPFRGRTPPTSTAPDPVLSGARTTALSADGGLSPDSRGLASGPSYCVGGPTHRLPCLTRGAVSPGRMYGPRGPRLDPWGPCRETTKPHADADSMRSWSTPPGRLCINRAERDGPALGIPQLCNLRASLRLPSASALSAYHKRLAMSSPIFRLPQGARRGGAGPGARGPRSGARAAAQTAPGGPPRPTPAA